MKIDILAASYAAVLDSLSCPICREPFHLRDGSLICEKEHCFDLSKKGYLNLVPTHDQQTEKYGQKLFEARCKIFGAGFYRPVMESITGLCQRLVGQSPFSLADIGCGEGYYTRSLSGIFPKARLFGLDISRDAIQAAARMETGVRWMVADLKHLPFSDGSLDVLLDVLTPADYRQFHRVLKKDGWLIKVIPGTRYLEQIREAVQPYLSRTEAYSNQPVLEHLKQNAELTEEISILHPMPLREEESAAFLRMTPMTFSVPEEALREIHLKEITIDMRIALCRFSHE